MRYLFIIALFFFYGNTYAQHGNLKKAMAAFHTALEQKDSTVLNRLLHNELVYGHSNGWKETKRDVIRNLYDGTLDYNGIDAGNEEIITEGKTACVRSTQNIDVVMNGKPLHISLHTLEVWVNTKQGWQLLSRQSVKPETKN